MPTPLLLLLSRGGRTVPKRDEGCRETRRPLSGSNSSDENGRRPIARAQPPLCLRWLSLPKLPAHSKRAFPLPALGCTGARQVQSSTQAVGKLTLHHAHSAQA